MIAYYTVRDHFIGAMRLIPPAGLALMLSLIFLTSCPKSLDKRTPLEIVKKVADKYIKETAFDFKLVPQRTVLGVQFVDFRQTFGDEKSVVGYALSYIISEKDTTVTFGLSNSDGVKIWINDQLLFQRAESRPATLTEIAYDRFVFQDTFNVKLREGTNKIVVKVASDRDEWIFFLRPMMPDGEEDKSVSFSLKPFAPEIRSTDWLCIGPFPYSYAKGLRHGLNSVYPPERELSQIYLYENRTVVWNVPKQNILLELEIKPTNVYKRRSYADWRYENGATMLGILALADETGDRRYIDFVRRYCNSILENLDYFGWQYELLHAFRGSFHKIFRRTMLDDTGAPALPFLEIYLREHPNEYEEFVDSIAEYIVHKQVRLDDGTFCRPEPVPMTVWADDLFMSVPFLLRMGKITGQQSYYDDAASQVIKFDKWLFDSEKSLFHHGWINPMNQTTVVFWGRANGWVVWAMAETLTHLPKNHPDYQKILEIFRKHITGLAEYQDNSGMWHQVLDHPESYEETSCTAMFVLGMARGIRNGWIEEKYRENAKKGWTALERKIDIDGIVYGVCTGTGIGDDLEFYFNRPTYANDPRGLGAVMIAGIEVSKLE